MTTADLRTILTDLLKEHSLEDIQQALTALETKPTVDAPAPTIEDTPSPAVSVEPEQPALETSTTPTPNAAESTPKEDSPTEVIDEEPEMHNPYEKRKTALKDMRHFAMWGKDGEESLQMAYDTFVQNGGKRSYADRLIEKANTIRTRLKPIKHQIINGTLKCTRKKYPAEVVALLKEYKTFSYYIRKDIEWAMGKHQETKALRTSKNTLTSDIPKAKTTPLHQLPHRPSWDLLIDESGKEFNDEANRSKSCIVGVLAPTDSNVEPLEIHSMEEMDPKVKLRHLRRFLSFQDWSLFGLRLDTISNVKGQQWIDSVAQVVAWVIRLIPAQEPTTITVHVEQRKPHAAGSEQSRIQRVLRQNLAQVDPERANNIALDIRFVHKYNPTLEQRQLEQGKSYPTHKWLAYADVIAHFWHSKEQIYKQWMKNSGLTHTFLHMDLYPAHMRILDTALEGTAAALSGEAWSRLMNDTSNNSTVIQYISEYWQARTRTDSKQWDRCMDEFQRHLYSKSINMNVLIKQSEWLQQVATGGSTYTLSNRDKLVFEMSQLASRNHKGEIITQSDIQDLQQLQKSMEFEDIRLICFLDLHLAVQLTHTYNFKGAIQLMKRWEDEDLRTIGINYKGRVLSTIGQQHAFQHEHKTAIDYFDQAIKVFGRLSSTDEAKKEQRQTRSYKVIAMMDSKNFTPKQIEDELIKLHPTCNTMEELCTHLKTDNSDADKFTHHIFIRYLYLYQPSNLLKQYIATPGNFKRSAKHPWGWISLYRGLLLKGKNDTESIKQLRHAVSQAQPRGIEEAIRVVFLETARRNGVKLDGKPIERTAIQTHIANVAKTNPNATFFNEHIQKVLGFNDWEPATWLEKLLPFNFH